MEGCYVLKYNGGDSGIKISVLYWRCSLIRVSVVRGSTGFRTAGEASGGGRATEPGFFYIQCVSLCVVENDVCQMMKDGVFGVCKHIRVRCPVTTKQAC
jgi:hypothetical protein